MAGSAPTTVAHRLPTVVKHDLDLVGTGDHVVVGDHEAVVAGDHAGALAHAVRTAAFDRRRCGPSRRQQIPELLGNPIATRPRRLAPRFAIRRMIDRDDLDDAGTKRRPRRERNAFDSVIGVADAGAGSRVVDR